MAHAKPRRHRPRGTELGPKPRKTGWLLTIGLAVVLIGCGFVVRRVMLSPKPNVVLIVIDTMRADAAGSYGNPRRPTPRLDAIAATGVRFTQAISTSGWTLPAIGSLLTGAWPTIHGGLGQNTVLTPLREELPTAAQVLKEHGFNTLGFANAAFVSPMLGFDRGFDVFDHRHAFNWEIRRADETINDALAHLREHRSEANFIFIHLFDPHLDYDPPPGYGTKYTDGRMDPPPPLTLQKCQALQTNEGEDPPQPVDIAYVRAVYDAEINFTDWAVGRLVDELQQLGIYDDTTLIVTADHGEEFWEHGGFEHGHTLYDELIRVPLILKPSVHVAPVRRVVESQVRLIDVMPTVFDLLDIEPPPSFVGQSLMPLVMGETDADRVAFSESTLYGGYLVARRGERYKYIVDIAPGSQVPPELYDWRADPGETNNLLAALPDVAAQMRAELSGFYNEMALRAKTMSQPELKDMSPQTIESLKSLGYIR